MQDSIQLSSKSFQTNSLNNQQNRQSPVNWISVINFLQEEYTKSTIREKQWFLEKKILNDQILKLKGQLNVVESLNQSLNNRIKLLQISLRKQNLKKSQNKGQNEYEVQKSKNIVQIEKYFAKNGWNFNQKPLKNNENNHHKFLSKVLSQAGLNINKIQQKCRKVSFSSNINDAINLTKTDKLQDFKSLIRQLQKVKLQQKTSINAHLDTVRGIYVQQTSRSNQTFITSVSQDCLLKTWSFDQKNKTQNIQPISTFRQHTGQLFALEGGQRLNSMNDLVMFTGGSEQFVKVWYNPNIQKHQQLSCIGFFLNDSKNNEENSEINQIVWQMKYKSKRLLTSSSDGVIRLFDVKIQPHQSSNISYTSQLEFLKDYKEKSYSQNVIQWVGQQGFLSGCSNFQKISLWDIETGRIMQKYEYEIQKPKDEKKKDPLFNSLFQTNSLKYLSDYKMILAGCQDKSLRIFSYNQNKIIKKISSGIKQSISCVDIYKNNYIVSGSHDGSLKIWDRRTFKELFNEVVHKVKYDEGTLCLKTTQNAIYTGGADGIIKTFKI